MNSQTIRIAEHGHEFFLRYPHAVSRLDILIAGADVPSTFHTIHERLQREHAEHAAAASSEQDTRRSITTLERSLRSAAYALERGLNAALDLTGSTAERVDFVPGTHLIASLEAFSASLTAHRELMAANPVYATSLERYQAELGQYRDALGTIGTARETADTEREEFFSTVDAYEPVVAALHALIQRYLAKADPALLAEYKQGLAAKSGKATKTVGQTDTAN